MFHCFVHGTRCMFHCFVQAVLSVALLTSYYTEISSVGIQPDEVLGTAIPSIPSSFSSLSSSSLNESVVVLYMNTLCIFSVYTVVLCPHYLQLCSIQLLYSCTLSVFYLHLM